jgi:hypothetical protein
MPTRAIAKKRCRAMVEPPEKGERATPNPNLSTRLNLLFFDQALATGWLLLVEEGDCGTGCYRHLRRTKEARPCAVAVRRCPGSA